MRHLKALSLPKRAQFEPFLQFVGLISAIIGLIDSINSNFGTRFLVKDSES